MSGPLRLVTERVQIEQSVVRVLEQALERAKAGEFKAVAIAGLCQDENGYFSHSKTDRVLALAGAVAVLHGKVLAE